MKGLPEKIRQLPEAVKQLPGAVKRALRTRKVQLALAGIGVAALVLAGVHVYLQKRAATLEYAVAQLNEAIAKGNIEELARRVDFVALSRDLAAAIAAVQSDSASGAQQSYQDIVQKRLLALFAQGGEGSGGGHAPAAEAPKSGHAPEGEAAGGHAPPAGAGAPPPAPMDAPVFDILKKPIHILPPDLLAQLQAHPFAIQAADADAAILMTTLEHAQIHQEFTLRLGMHRTAEGWRVTGISRPEQFVRTFTDRIKTLEAEAVEAFEQENARIASLMSTYYHIDSCASVLFPPDSSGVVRLRVSLKGSNMGERDLVAAAAVCSLLGPAEDKLASLRLENTRAVKVGETFEHAWFYNFEERYPEVDALVAAKDVRCTAETSAVSMGRGVLLYPRKLKDLPGVRLE